MNYRNPRLIFLLGIVAAAVATYGVLRSDDSDDAYTSPPLTRPPESLPYSERAWLTYVDEDFEYRIQYPSGLSVHPVVKEESGVPSSENDLGEDGGASFATDGPGVMGVKVYVNPSVSSFDAWLAFENQRSENTRIDVEESIIIGGQEALVTHKVSLLSDPEEPFVDEKRAVLFRDGVLFEIWTKFYENESDHERVWESFGFLD